MRSYGAAANDVAQRELKERGLRQFIDAYLAGVITSPAAEDGARACLLLARSPDSPVARVVAEYAAGKRLQLPVRAILTTLEASTQPTGQHMAALPLFAVEIRLVRDPRLLEAHEQLVLGVRASWTGDSMRRDPLKRDAYEAYAPDDRAKALRAIASFERLWRVALPVAGDVVAAGPEAPCAGSISEPHNGPPRLRASAR
ncbi:MAG TPA: hypothetical protein VNK52_04355 [Hyphomicrobiaceae bacterium]|nr:hypothetical protein [Hyphomicrobiaceae bacterium]